MGVVVMDLNHATLELITSWFYPTKIETNSQSVYEKF
jgi:hypothetical protein